MSYWIEVAPEVFHEMEGKWSPPVRFLLTRKRSHSNVLDMQIKTVVGLEFNPDYPNEDRSNS